jgi:micrococcal nuclease
MQPGRSLRNIFVAIVYLLFSPLILVLGLYLYVPYAIATNRHNLGNRLANSPLGAIPTIRNGGIQSAATVFVAFIIIPSALGAAMAVDTGTDPATETDNIGDELSEAKPPTGDESSSGDPTVDPGDGKDKFTAEIISVIDGDTVEIRTEGGEFDTVRLLGVDSPEVSSRVNTWEFEGIPDTEASRKCLDGYGTEASSFAERQLDGATVTVKIDPVADRRGSYDRLLAYIIVDGTNFNYKLLDSGHARVYNSQFSQSERFYDAESEAQESETGLWSCRSVDSDTT